MSLLRRCISDAGVDETSVDSIYLVGGASRSPIVERLVKDAFPAVHVSRRGDPKTSVALVPRAPCARAGFLQRAGRQHAGGVAVDG